MKHIWLHEVDALVTRLFNCHRTIYAHDVGFKLHYAFARMMYFGTYRNGLPHGPACYRHLYASRGNGMVARTSWSI